MSVLPIVSRELRVAARKRSTFWARVVAAIVAVLLGTGWILMTQWQGFSTAQMGSTLFSTLTWLCLAAALSAGLFFTSDCLSEEKREGTLGFLFLTDLRGYDVITGKLLATSLRALYGLLAFLPILALTQTMGGVTAAQYWKSALALVNALLYSLSAGMVISAISRDSQKALFACLGLMLFLSVGGPVADWILLAVKKRGAQPIFSLTSPGYVLFSASAWGRSRFWVSLLITQICCWTLFGFACALIPRTWQIKQTRQAIGRGWFQRLNYGGFKRQVRLRKKLLERRPVAWLSCRERWQMWALWAMGLLTVCGFASVGGRTSSMGVWMVWNYLGGLFTLLLYLWAASQACRFLVEVRRSGFLELLLVTPLGPRNIIRGQWDALGRMFGLPLLLLLSATTVGAVLGQLSMHRFTSQVATMATGAGTNQTSTITTQNINQTTTVVISSPKIVSSRRFSTSQATQTTNVPAPSTTWTNTIGMPGTQQMSAQEQFFVAVATGLSAALSTVGGLLALIWFGMWMGLTSRTANIATLKTIMFVQVIPWFVLMFLSGILMMILVTSSGFMRSQPARWFVWWPLASIVLSTVLALGKDIVFIIWSRKKLYSTLRERAGMELGVTSLVALPSLPPGDLPPVIPDTAATHGSA